MLKIQQLESWHFWFVARRVMILDMLKERQVSPASTVVDLGCGTGYMANVLTAHARRVIGIDQHRDGIAATQMGHPVLSGVQADAVSIPLDNSSIDGVLLLDMLEHLDDRRVLSETLRVLKRGGWAVVTVPAFPALWSYRDQAAGHLRRYSRAGFENLLKEYFEVPLLRYYQFLLFPLLVISRYLGRKNPRTRDLEENIPGFLNTLLTCWMQWENRIGKKIYLPWGSSMVALCVKK